MKRFTNFDRIKFNNILKAQGRKQKWLAEELDISERYVSDISRGVKFPTTIIARAIADELGVDISAFEKSPKAKAS